MCPACKALKVCAKVRLHWTVAGPRDGIPVYQHAGYLFVCALLAIGGWVVVCIMTKECCRCLVFFVHVHNGGCLDNLRAVRNK